MGVVVGRKNSHPDRRKLVYLWHICTPQDNAKNKHQFQGFRQQKKETLVDLQGQHQE